VSPDLFGRWQTTLLQRENDLDEAQASKTPQIPGNHNLMGLTLIGDGRLFLAIKRNSDATTSFGKVGFRVSAF
jgi:hypothetical protein